MSARFPVATYRLQFNQDFTFAHAIEIVDYLRDLGISDVYASPVLKAGPASTHGYDVCSFEEVNPMLGGGAGFDALAGKLRDGGMGLLLDFVPNHMGTDCSNAWLEDALERGQQSRFGGWLDIDWDSPVPGLNGKVLLPILEDIYGQVLEAGKLRLAHESGHFVLKYYERAFPLRQETQERLRADVAARGLDAVVATFNGKVGEPRSFDLLDHLLEEQHFRLGWWRLAGQVINYRRFFDVTELIAVRMELSEVFSAAHRSILGWLRQGKLSGLRIDHPDGLFDPRQYFERLQRAAGPDAADDDAGKQSFYIVAEKILSGDERLPRDWPVAGTTGYDFLNQANGLFVDSTNEAAFSELYRDFIDYAGTFEEAARAGKKKVLLASFLSELDGLCRTLLEIGAQTRSGKDLTLQTFKSALAEIIAGFPVYRTYATRETERLSETERLQIQFALEEARQHASAIFLPAIEWIGSILLLQTPADLPREMQARCREFVLRFQQLTGPVTAKGVEDTAFYNYNRLVSLNEVGGNPARFGNSVEAFHQYNAVTARFWPHSLLATATHDTKRGEDARARLNVLSEMPGQWKASIKRWQQLNRRHKTRLAGQLAPDTNDEYLLYLSLIGAWPEAGGSPGAWIEFRDRITAYMLKAMREAKRHTSWTEPNAGYEQAAEAFVQRVLDPKLSSEFYENFEPLQRIVEYFGGFNSLSQTLLKLTSPGVPDLYQGTELWDLSLVDPDNRRPVDYALRHATLERVKQWAKPQGMEITAETKMFLIHRALQIRNQFRELFDQGDYLPISVAGAKKNHLCAFARTKGSLVSITIVPRLVYGLMSGERGAPAGKIWEDTVLGLPPRLRALSLKNVLTGESLHPPSDGTIPISSILAQFPLALMSAI